MTLTLGLVANVFNEIHALPGWLEAHLPHFDEVKVMHASPGGVASSDGTLELLHKWRVPVEWCDIGEGFGAVRTKTLCMSKCDYVMLLDADERFHAFVPGLRCAGCSTPQDEADRILRGYDYRDGKLPDWNEIDKLGSDLKVTAEMPYGQMERLRFLLRYEAPDVVVTVRRHWHEFGFSRPTQNWLEHPDWQARIVRNSPDIYFDHGTRMHERLVGASQQHRANFNTGPFFDHYHFVFKRMEPDQRRHDIMIYDALNRGETPPLKG